MRLMRITTDYPRSLQEFHGRIPDIVNKSYREQYRLLMLDHFGWADHWTHALEAIGYTVWEPVANARPQQFAWAHEHGVRPDERNWLFDITTAQIKDFRPEILFVDDYETFAPAYLAGIRNACPSIRLLVGWCGAPFSDEAVFSGYDLMLSNIKSLVSRFRAKGRRWELLAHAFDPRVLDMLGKPSEPVHDFTFCGSIIKSSRFHRERELLLRKLAPDTPLTLFSDARPGSPVGYALLHAKELVYRFLRALRSMPLGTSVVSDTSRLGRFATGETPGAASHLLDPAILRMIQPPVYGLQMFRTLLSSRIVFNTHIDISKHHASNMRLFEATGVGACLLTDHQEDLNDLFEPDREVITYRTCEEAVEKVRYYLSHDAERAAIADAGQRRTLRDHTFERRAPELDAYIHSCMP